ncbi:MAG: zinc-binding dehydrogenase [Labilithrix sp.]|nr:zinc-binding dehydrogenase [Labilithrix sp.]MCW5813120.1 zinc-binding dehydrogenase [Labilithrix sp.]
MFVIVKRVRIRSAGGYEKLEIEEVAAREPAQGEVRIAVEAIGVNFADCIVRMGLYASAKEYVGWPITPGFEVAGRVDRVGEGVTRHRVGDRVIGLTRFDGYATSVVVPEHQAFGFPAAWSMEAAAGFAVVFFTADYALSELAHPRKGASLLVHSAAGGVGTALLQLARAYELRAIGVVGAPHKVKVAKEQGAEHVIDKSSEDLWAAAERYAPKGYDVVLDANGVETLAGSYEHLRPTGRLVVYGFHTMMRRGGPGTPSWPKLALDWLRTPRFNPLDLTNDNKSVMAFNLSYLFEERALIDEARARLMALADRGAITPPATRAFPFDAVADAHRAIESGTTTGKLVLTVGPPRADAAGDGSAPHSR